jgi:hypothetical protein
VRSVNYRDLMKVCKFDSSEIFPRVLYCNSISARQKIYFANETAICYNQWKTVLQETEKSWPVLSRTTLKHVMFLIKIKNKQYFCGYSTLTEGVFVSSLKLPGMELQFLQSVYWMRNPLWIQVFSILDA